MNHTIMKKKTKQPPTLTDLLKVELQQAESIRAVARACELDHAALLRFARGDQSIRLEAADKLATYFGIKHIKEAQ